jgi:hypothetical protein
MRLVFFSLVLLNLGILVWGLFIRDKGESVLSEQMGSMAPVASSPADGVELVADEVSEPLCELVGPFPGQDDANSFQERLDSIDIRAQVMSLDLPAGTSYRVYLEPLESEEAAHRKLAELQAKGVDSYIMRKGSLKNAISLGMFTQEGLADERVKLISSMGLSPRKDVVERTQIEIWVMLEQGEAAKMSPSTWENMLSGLDAQERRQNFCLDVASQGNIH